MIDPQNIAILNSLISVNEAGQLQLTFYVQCLDGYFLSGEQLQIAVEVSSIISLLVSFTIPS